MKFDKDTKQYSFEKYESAAFLRHFGSVSTTHGLNCFNLKVNHDEELVKEILSFLYSKAYSLTMEVEDFVLDMLDYTLAKLKTKSNYLKYKKNDWDTACKIDELIKESKKILAKGYAVFSSYNLQVR